MKQLIVPIAIIVALIAFFVIIDRKEFSRHDNVQTVQRENPLSNGKSSASVPKSKMATELKPAVEIMPIVETKQVTDPTPVTVAKPKTNANLLETKLEEKPIAIPVATVEEAEKYNGNLYQFIFERVFDC